MPRVYTQKKHRNVQHYYLYAVCITRNFFFVCWFCTGYICICYSCMHVLFLKMIIIYTHVDTGVYMIIMSIKHQHILLDIKLPFLWPALYAQQQCTIIPVGYFPLEAVKYIMHPCTLDPFVYSLTSRSHILASTILHCIYKPTVKKQIIILMIIKKIK